MSELIEQQCVAIFRNLVGHAHSVPIMEWDNARLLGTPIDALDLDSLTVLEFVMEIESTYDVELNEASVNACQSIRDLAALVSAAKQ
jgi:hypothetical protein